MKYYFVFIVFSYSCISWADTLLEDLIDFNATIASAGGYAVLKESELAKIRAEFEREKARLVKFNLEQSKVLQEQFADQMIHLYDLEINTFISLIDNSRAAAELFLKYMKELNPYIAQRGLEAQRTSSIQARAGITELLKKESEMGSSPNDVLDKLNQECSSGVLISCVRHDLYENGLKIKTLQTQLIELADDSELLLLFDYLIKSYSLNKDLEARNTKNVCMALIERNAYLKLLPQERAQKLNLDIKFCSQGNAP